MAHDPGRARHRTDGRRVTMSMAPEAGKLFVLAVSDGGHVFSANADGSDRRVLVNGTRIPDSGEMC